MYKAKTAAEVGATHQLCEIEAKTKRKNAPSIKRELHKAEAARPPKVSSVDGFARLENCI